MYCLSGKRYPGGQLSRRTLSILWREDRQPTWNNPALFAGERALGVVVTVDPLDESSDARKISNAKGLGPSGCLKLER